MKTEDRRFRYENDGGKVRDPGPVIEMTGGNTRAAGLTTEARTKNGRDFSKNGNDRGERGVY